MTDKKTTPPKGGRKGGTRFPRVNLQKSLEYAKKLVAKTHTGPQPKDTIYPGVFGVTGTIVNERVSALRQYGLLDGSETKGFEATEFAKKVCAAPDGEAVALYAEAFLRPKLFRKVYDTFAGDTTTIAKIRQQVSALKVHPDYADLCVELFLDSAEYANLSSRDGDNATFVTPSVPTASDITEADCTDIEDPAENPNIDPDNPEGNEKEKRRNDPQAKGKASVQINIDPSMDAEKLEKMLKVLRDYGQI